MSNNLVHKWYFRKKTANESNDDGNFEDLFDNLEAHLEQTLVRESIQNALDAKVNSKENVQIKFSFVGNIRNQIIEKYLISLKKHLINSEKIDKAVKFDNEIDLLLIEDFNTSGLTGDFKNQAINKRNNINSFWWDFNISNKKGISNKGGSRGIGRTVNIIASKCRSFLTFSNRADDNKNIILGLSNLGHHRIDEKLHDTWGRYCSYESDEKQIQPIELDNNEAKDFLDKIGSKRYIDGKIEGGTSNIILWPQEIIDQNDLIKWVVINYSPVIVKKDLSVFVNDQEINSETIKDYVNVLTEKEANFLDVLAEITSKKFDEISIDITETNNFDVKSFFSDEEKTSFRNRINQNEILKFKVKCIVKTKEEQKNKQKGVETFFEFFIKKTKDLNVGVCKFLRGNMPVMSEGKSWSYPANAYFYAQDQNICSMLVDAEPPNHSSWSSRAERFKKYGNETRDLLKFIKNFPFDFYDTVFNVSEEYDDVTFADAFPIGDSDDNSFNSEIENSDENLDDDQKEQVDKEKVLDFDNKQEEEESNESSDKVLDLDPTELPNYKIRKLKGGGFKFFANNKKKDIESYFPRKCRITIGYSSIGKKRGIDGLSSLDIDLNNDPALTIDKKNINNLEINNNSFEMEIQDHNFEIIVKGLDGENRDTEIRVKDI